MRSMFLCKGDEAETFILSVGVTQKRSNGDWRIFSEKKQEQEIAIHPVTNTTEVNLVEMQYPIYAYKIGWF